MLVDSHCHLDLLNLEKYTDNLDLALQAAAEQGITRILNVSVDLERLPKVLAIANQYPHVDASVGIHPNEPNTPEEPSLEALIQWAKPDKVVAIGETGLDYYRTESNPEFQKERFRRHITAAKELKKPLIIHTRAARVDTIQILREENANTVRGVMHCFTEDWEMAKKALDLDFFISFSGIITFKNAEELRQVALQVPLEKMLIETDAPFLAPVPMRGKSNEPAYIRYVAEFIAELKQIPFELFAEQTTKNYFTLFHHQKQSVFAV